LDIRQWGRGVGLLVAALMVFGACGGVGGTVLPTPVKTKDPLAGDYVASGANGANPQMTALITRFSQLHPGVNFKLNDIDTETSIVNVNTGDVDFGYIGRDLRTTEPKITLTAIGFTGMDFETAVRERIPILSILLNNFSMAIELKVMPISTEKYRSTDISGNYADFAKALGGYGERVTEPGQIKEAIKRGIAQTREGKPALLEFITEKAVDVSRFG